MHSFRISAVLVAALLGAGLASAQQSLIVSQGQTIAFSGLDATPTGDFVPGLSMFERFGGVTGASPAAIDDSGRVLFRAQIVDSAGVQYPAYLGYLSRGYFLGDSRGTLVKILQGGDPEPSGTIPGATLQTSSLNVQLSGTPRIASNGLMMFGATIWDVSGGTITTANDAVLYVGTPSNWQILAREMDVAPGCGGATYSSDFSSLNYSTTSINSAGQILFQSSLAGPSITTANNLAWFTGSVGNVQLMLRRGDPAPGGAQLGAIGSSAQMNASGQVLTEVTYAVGTGTPPVTTANDKALWRYSPGSGNTEIMREGNASPIPGTFYGSPALAGPSVFNAAGQALVSVALTGAVSTGVDDNALFLASPSSISVVLRRGNPAPGAGGASFNSVANFNMCLNDSGTVAFTSTLAGGGVTSVNDSGLWTGTAGHLMLIAREGDVAPGSGGQTFGAFSSSVFLNAAGQVLFLNTLSGGALSASLYSWDPVLGLQPVCFPNDSVQVQPGVLRTLFTIGAALNSNGDGRLLSFANDGTVTLRPGFTDGSYAVVTVRIGSLTALPRKISQVTGATQNLYLNAGLAHAGQLYVVVGSASGTNPGTPIGAFIVPLNLDYYTNFTLANINAGPFVNTLGVLNAGGRGLAQIVIPPLPGAAGLVVHHAYGVLDAFNNLVFASEAAPLEITP